MTRSPPQTSHPKVIEIEHFVQTQQIDPACCDPS
jgi:hypothetical protein